MEELTPNTRYEKFLAAAAGNGQRPDPATRDEKFLAALSGDYNAPEPVTRDEKMLAYAAGNHDAITPNTRHEKFIAALSGDIDVPDPITREEKFWSEIAQNAERTIGPDSIVSFIGRASTEILGLTAAIAPVQDLHGYDAPWPAGGNLNLLDFSKTSVGGTHYGMTFTKGTAEGTVVISGTLATTSGAVAPIDYADYSLSGKGYVFLTEHISGDSVVELNRTYGFRTENEKAIAVYLSGNVGQSYTETIRISVYATTQTSWSPYSNICPITGWTGANVYVSPTQNQADATVYNVDWTSEAGTVYGGTVDVVTGKLTVDYVKKTITSVSLWGSSNPNGTPVYVMFSDTDHITDNIDATVMKSNIFTYSPLVRAVAPIYAYGGSDGASSTQTFILPSTVTTKAEADAWFAANPTECIFKLATPIEYTLTPQEVQPLVGQNNVWSDAGDVTVKVKGAKTSA